MTVREATARERTDWDRLAVDGPGGHVYQSIAWGEHRAAMGWTPMHLVIDEGHPALVLARRWPLIGSAGAYVPRGPVVADGAGAAAAERLIALAAWLAGKRAIDVVASDAEVLATDTAYRARLVAGGFHPIAEIQPSRHRVSLPFAGDTDDTAVRAAFTKSTRQRINAAERAGILVVRHDRAGWQGGRPLFEPPSRSLADDLGAFATMLEGTGERRGFRFGPREDFIAWWERAHAAGHLVLLVALDAASALDARPLGGLMLYRHGGRLSSVHSADTPETRERHPGVMHLLRWRAIQLAIREGSPEIDLGGVDAAPDHLEPREGDPLSGLYEHKRSFGAHWVPLTGAHERVTRPTRYAVGRLAARLVRTIGR